MYEAARVGDSIDHSSALAGFLVGAIIGIALIAAVAFCTVTAGFGAALIAGMLAGFGAQGILSLGEAIGSAFKSKAGVIVSGSHNVNTNGKPAAHAELSNVACDKHTPLKRIAEGSGNVFINGKAAARKDDRTECDGTIADGSPNVYIGGGTVQHLKIAPEIPQWVRTAVSVAFIVAGFAGGLAGTMRLAMKKAADAGEKLCAKCAAKVIGGFAVGAGISEVVVRGIAGLVGHPVDVSNGQKILQSEFDLSLPGRLPIEVSRFYSSDIKSAGLLGRGWRLSWESSIRITDKALIYTGYQGRELSYPPLKVNQQYYDAAEQHYITRVSETSYVVHSLDMVFSVYGEFNQDGIGHLYYIEDQFKNAIHLVWNENGQLEKLAGTCGNLLHFEYQSIGKVEDKQFRLKQINCVKGNCIGEQINYQYDNSGQLAAVVDSNGIQSRGFTYNEDFLMRQHVDAAGLICSYIWQEIDGEARVIRQSNNAGEDYKFDYDFKNSHTQVSNVFGEKADWYFDKYLNIVKHTDFAGAEYSFEYNDASWPTVLNLPENRTIKLEYDAFGRVIKEINPLGEARDISYHANTLLINRTTLDDGRTWIAQYSETGLLQYRRDPLGLTESISYNSDNLPESITDAKGGVVKLKYDQWGQLLERTDCSDKTTSYTYTQLGKLISLKNAAGQVSSLKYNAAGQIEKLIRPDLKSESYTWDNAGLLSSHTNALGKTQRWKRNYRGQVVKSEDAAKRTLSYDYDAHGRLIKLTNGNGASYQFAWNAADRLIKEIRLDGTKRKFEYNQAGDLQSVSTIANGRVRRIYKCSDALGRVIAIESLHSKTICSYNRLGQLEQIKRTASEAGTALGIEDNQLKFEYDKIGQLLKEHSADKTISYEYDQLGNPTKLILPQQQQLQNLYYGSGHAHQISFNGQVIADFERDDLHREILRTQGKLTTYTGYNKTGQRAWQRSGFYAKEPEAGTIPDLNASELWRDYKYDANGELIISRDKLSGSTNYNYDAVGQLVNRLAENFDVERFDWDAAGNLVEQESKNTPLLDNLIRQYAGKSYEYDQWGQLTKKTNQGIQQEFIWDVEGHLIECKKHNTITKYQYDALGRRISKTSTDRLNLKHLEAPRISKTSFVWQGLRLIQEQTAEQISTYIYDPNAAYTPIARVDQYSYSLHKSNIYYYHSDQTGTPREVTDADGKIIWRGRYQAWGKVLANLAPEFNSFKQNLRMAGQYHDEESGLHYNTFRYYDPDTAKFVSSDPIGLNGGLNLYQYAPNPYRWIDPLGLDWNYYLQNALGEIYYHGRASINQSMAKVIWRHSNTRGSDGARFGVGDSINRITKFDTDKRIVRGIENSAIREGQVFGRGSLERRGNLIHGIADEKLATPKGGEMVDLANEELSKNNVSKASELKPLETKQFKGGC